MNEAEILIIDDEAQIRRLLKITLESNGFRVNEAVNAKEGLLISANHPPELILLDLGLPDENGQEVLVKLRTWYKKPIIILSVLSSEEEIVRALDNGADDYLVKPFRTGELLARIRTALRKVTETGSGNIIEGRQLKIDLIKRTVTKNGQPVKLTATEYLLIALFAQNEGKVLTHQYVLKEIWGPGYIGQSQYLRVFIAALRKKIEDDPNKPEYLVTESGVGYRFVIRN